MVDDATCQTVRLAYFPQLIVHMIGEDTAEERTAND